ncbi:MAG: MinD/ParA family protein [Candidatus Micrarchaeota archaeon]|nr:MinD/ParA family protein [Candidatus Micrarchaeota archaeon]
MGKTTIALNLAVALTYKKYKVLLVDTDTESASLSEQLGVRPEGRGYLDMLNSNAEVKDMLFSYEPIDLYLIPGSPSEQRIAPKSERLVKLYSKLAHADFDFVIIDSPPGLFSEEVARYFNDVAILTTPDSVSSSGSAKMAEYCRRFKLEHRLIINRMGYSKFDLEREEVERLYGDVAFQAVPEDKIIEESLMKHKPAYMIDRNADFCVAIDELARDYALKLSQSSPGGDMQFERDTKPGLFEKLAKWFMR